MKSCILFATLVFLAASAYCGVLQHSDYVEVFQGIEDDFNSSPDKLVKGIKTTGSTLLYGGHFIAEPGDVRLQTLKMRLAPNTRITSIHIRGDETAVVSVLEGGVGTNHVTIQMQSPKGLGFNIFIDVYGHH